ncbi:MAG TPA: DNA polymerase I [Planctomycetaceae bacterium]|nr:DNA polymerase I [Planctomycetaceae bacterium]
MGKRRQQKVFAFDEETSPPSTAESAQRSTPATEPSTTGKSAGRKPKLPTSKPPQTLAGETVYIVDAHALIYQVFHAMPAMTGPRGQPVGAIHGFIRDMLTLLREKQPNYLFCTFDSPGPTFRHDQYDQYKINREAMPEDLRQQIPGIQEMLGAMDTPVLKLAGFEADDIIATLARQVDELGGEAYLVTNDKDCRQLISPRVCMYNIRKDSFYDAEALLADWGIRPDQVVEFQALVGDSVDNVPGVPQIGPKTARDLLQQYETLEGVFAHAHEIKAKKRRETLMENRDLADLSLDLVRLKDDVPIEVDWEQGRVGGIDRQRVAALCQQWGFRRLAERLESLEVNEAPEVWEADYRTVATEQELEQLVESLSSQQRISIDTETTSLNPRSAELVGYSFAWEPGRAFYVPVRAPAGEPQLAVDLVNEKLRPLLEDPEIEKIGQNIKYDMVVLRSHGIYLRGITFDTMVADYLLDPGQRNHGLDDLARRYLNHTNISIKDLIGSGKNQKQMDEVPVDQVTPYAAEDADVPLRLTTILEEKLREEGLLELFQTVEIPLIEVLAELEFNGILVDAKRLEQLGTRFGDRLADLQVQIYDLAGSEFNVDSPKQLSKVLFEDLGLPVIKRTKTGPSTDVEVLNQLAKLAVNELPQLIIEYRQLAKLKGTYVDALPAMICKPTKRVHTSFKQDVAATGRLSSKDPNLQNIPIRSEEGKAIRSAFLPGEKDWLLFAADYSQIELRVLAHFSQDKELQEAFATDQDVHAAVASEVYEVDLADVTSEMRRSAKAINFGVIYGQSAFGLAKSLDIDVDEAAEFIESYFSHYQGVDEFLEQTLLDCQQKGFVSTVLGRKRVVQGIRDADGRGKSRQRNMPERIAINTVIQGSAADLIKLAMLKVHDRLHQEGLQARMLLQIHDELLFEVPATEVPSLRDLLVEEMTSVGEMDVPLKVDLEVGENWADCRPLE